MKPFRTLATRRGMTLVEVMIAAMVFTMLGLSTNAVFIWNYKMTTTFRYRTHATNAALNILEQLRTNQYTTVKAYHDAALLGLTTIPVKLADPNYVPASPAVADGFRPVNLNLNIVDSVQKNSTWTSVNLPLSDSLTAPQMQTRFWTTINSVVSATAPVVELYEIVVVYQWKNPAPDASQQWQSGTIRLTLPNLNPKT